MNNICLIGRLVRDPEMRTTNTGKNVASFTIAVDKRMRPQDGEPTADFFRCSVWSQSANYLCDYGAKGRMVSLSGRMECRKYTDKDGNERDSWEVTASEIKLIDKRPDDGGGDGGGQSTGGYGQTPRSAGGAGNQRPAARPAASPAADEYDPFADD